MDTGPQEVLGAADPLHRPVEPAVQVSQIARGPIGERAVGLGPDELGGIELRGIGGKEVGLDTAAAAQEVGDGGLPMDGPPIPQQDYRAVQVPQEGLKERPGVEPGEVTGPAGQVEGQPSVLRGHRQGADRGDPIPAEGVDDHRGLAAGRPRAADRRDEEEAALVEEDEVGAQVRCPFFSRGHSRRFQRAMAASSRSRARRMGFWQLQPRAVRIRHT